jgi:molybdopterin molybdotransferase
MLSVDQTYDLILATLDQQKTIKKISVPLAEARGKVLAQEIVTDRAYPPYHRVAMDGYAFSSEAHLTQARYRIEKTARPGEEVVELNNFKTGCIKVFTGSVLPRFCHLVIPYEHVSLEKGNVIINNPIHFKPWANVHRAGSDADQGQLVIQAGTKLNALHLATIASLGFFQVDIFSWPKTVVVATGDELGHPQASVIADYQIRSSNGIFVEMELREMGVEAVSVMHVKDDFNVIKKLLKNLLQEYQLIFLSGGISLSDNDHLRHVFSDLAVATLVPAVAQKPGKPFFVGQGPEGQILFSLPGNPQASYVCMRRYIKEAFYHFTHMTQDQKNNQPIKYDKNKIQAQKVTKFWIGNKRHDLFYPMEHQGSGDFLAITHSDGFLEIPAIDSVDEKSHDPQFFSWDQSGL